MKKLFLGIFAAAVLMACNQSNQANGTTSTIGADTAITKSAPADAPIMKFDSVTHSFGKINQGDKVTYAFKFTNAGKSPLIVSDAVASCGCTRPEWPHVPIQPGGSESIKVTFDSANKKGLQDKMITITANTLPRQNMVHLIGEVLAK